MKPHMREKSRNKQSYKPARNKLIAVIHVAKKQLGLTEDIYRDILFATTEKESLKDMNIDDLNKVIKAFEDQGFKKKSNSKRTGSVRRTKSRHVKLIRALWISLYQLGEVKNPSENALNAYAKRMTKVDNLHWLPPHKEDSVIASLRDWMKRAGYERPIDDDYLRFAKIHAQNPEFIKNSESVISAAHVLMAQARIAFKDVEGFHSWIAAQGFVSGVHPYKYSAEEIHSLCEELAKIIRGDDG